MAWSSIASAGATLVVSGILGEKALLSVDGSVPKVLGIGEAIGDIRLVAVERDAVVVEEEGRLRTVRMGFARSSSSGDGEKKVVLMADAQGMFFSDGQVNGAPARFLVDTGASLVVLPKSLARRAGISLDRAPLRAIATAGGVVPGWIVKLNQVRVGDIRLHMIDAAVLEDVYLPNALLGMSFLTRTNIHREGDRLDLTRRY